MMLILLGLGVFTTMLLVISGLLLAGDEKRQVRVALRSLSPYELAPNLRDQEMLQSVRERVILPTLARLAQLSNRFTPDGYTNQVKHKIVLAGSPAGFDVERFLALKALAIGSAVLWGYAAFGLLGLGGFFGLIFTVGMTVLSFFYPDSYLTRKKEERQYQIALRLPDVLDLLTISVEAGLGFEQAIDRTIATIPGPLSDEFGRMLRETRVGSTRAEALRAMEARTDVPELRSFILAMLQADTFGVSIGRILRSQSDEMRIRRRQRAQEKAQKAPVKMLFPLIFCIFPSLFVVILGPAAVQITRTL